MERYFAKTEEILRKVIDSQKEAMMQAAEWCAQALKAGKQLYFFGTGHSHMIAEEAFYRAGGLVDVRPILETSLMLHEGAAKSTKLERMEGYAAILVEEYQVGKGDVLFVISNSGRNAVPVEMAIEARKAGATVIAITNLRHSMQIASRHSSGKKLYEAAELAIDNCGDVGDAAVYIDAMKQSVGPTSTVIGTFIVNSIVVQTVENCLRQGFTPPVILSANLDAGDAHNERFMKKDQMKVRSSF